MALDVKKLIVQNKTRRARISAIKKLIAGIPTAPRSYDFYDDQHDVITERAEMALANKIRAILDGPAFEPAYQPGNTDNGKPNPDKTK